MAPSKIGLVVHATHEAGVKVGGIGAVLDGLLSAQAYNERVARTILAGPMNGRDATEMERLLSPRNGLQIYFSSLQGIFDGVPEELRLALQRVEQTFEVAILYGRRRFGHHEHEVVLVDVTSPNRQQMDTFRHHVWQNYGFDCARYGWNPELNLFLDSAPPLLGALMALGAGAGLATNDKFIIAHEWLGLPLVFAAQMTQPEQWCTVFYAHETATARRLVEEHGGHDTRFYNTLFKAQEWNLTLESLFGSQDDLYKHPMIKQAVRCDNIFAVGDLVVDELRFLGDGFTNANIDLVYNGIPSTNTTLAEKLESKQRLQTYCANLLGYIPDYVFTHVTRLVLSKSLWRDMRVMEHLEQMLAQVDKRAVLFVLSTSVPAGRRPEWVYAWEQQYGWPVGHRGDNGDLIDAEAPYFFNVVEPFNRRASHSQVVFVNQFGWSQDRCGQRMPSDMEFMDIRRGSDLEFGQSIYEPFGIAQVEPLTFGSLCCVSSVCGCVGFVARAADGLHNAPNLVVADYVRLPDDLLINGPYEALSIDGATRDWIESTNAAGVAQTIFERLPKSEDEMQALLESGQAIARGMSWDVVAREFLFNGLQNAMR